MNSKVLLIPALALVGLVGYTTIAQAQDSVKPSMAHDLASKLGVSEDKVTGAFDEMHTERETEMKSREEARLQQLVDEGTITADQKLAISAKRDEIAKRHEEERKELQEWADNLGIDMSMVGPIGMGHDKFIYRIDK